MLTEQCHNFAVARLGRTSKRFALVVKENVTPKVKRPTFALREDFMMREAQLRPYAYAQTEFGPGGSYY